MEEWWAVANGPIIWISGFVLAGIATLGAVFMQIEAIRKGKKIGFGMDKIHEIRKAAILTAIGPGLGIIFGMLPLMIALSSGMAWLRESAGIGSIMYELITASQGAEAAGMKLGPGMTLEVFASALFIMSTACLPWLIMTMIYTPIAGKMAEKSKQFDPKALPLIIVGMMLIVFGDTTASRTLPLLSPNFVAALISAVCTLAIFIFANKINRPNLKEYALVISMLIGMFGAYAIFGG